MGEKEAIELEYIKLLSLKGEETDIREKAGDLADKENTLLKKDLDKARKDLKSAKETILKAQKEVTELHAEAAGLRAQLQDALNDARQYQNNAADCMHANEQLRQSLMGAQENISELIKLRKEDEIVYLQQFKSCQMDWEMEREKLLEANDRETGDRVAKLMKQNFVLKKRLKQSYQVLASITCDCNKLKEELKEKSTLTKEEKGRVEKAPADTVTLSERQCSKYAHFGERREEFALPTSSESRRRPLHLDMTHLAQRQIKVLDSLVAT